MEGPEIHQFMSLEKGLSDLDTVFDGTRISIGGLHWDYILCVSAVGIKQGIEQQEGKRQLDGASSQTMGPLLVYSGVQCDFDPYNTVEENTYSYSLVCSMVHLLVNSLCSPNFCWSTFNSC